MWITDGNRNTSFFHQKAINRKQRNIINGLTDDSRVWHEDDQGMERIILDYFSNIFQSNSPTDTTAIDEAIQPVVTKSMNNFLCQPFQEVEVHKALKQMHPKKSTGLDGMPPLFYQHFWLLSGEYVTKAVLDFLNLGIIPLKFNETNVILTSKVKNPHKHNIV